MKDYLFMAAAGIVLLLLLSEIGKSKEIKPLYEQSYVAVYGRNSCGFTQRMIRDLEASNISYKYFMVDDKYVADSLHARMKQSGISTQHYNLPVVDVNGLLNVRPDFNDVVARFKEKAHNNVR